MIPSRRELETQWRRFMSQLSTPLWNRNFYTPHQFVETSSVPTKNSLCIAASWWAVNEQVVQVVKKWEVYHW